MEARRGRRLHRGVSTGEQTPERKAAGAIVVGDRLTSSRLLYCIQVSATMVDMSSLGQAWMHDFLSA